jgi:hypothetical protein
VGLAETATGYEWAFAGLGLLALLANLAAALFAAHDRRQLGQANGYARLAANWGVTITVGLLIAQLGIFALAAGALFRPQASGVAPSAYVLFVRWDVLFVQATLAALALLRLRFRYETIRHHPEWAPAPRAPKGTP